MEAKERLTFLNGDDVPCVTEDNCMEEQSGHYCGPAIDRLAAYEDTRQAPEEIYSLYGEWCAMMSVLNSIGSYDRLRELAEADRDGRVVVLPCRVGDTVYFVSKRYKCINELTINSVESIVLLGKKWGKCVFVSREEAEKALEAAKRDG